MGRTIRFLLRWAINITAGWRSYLGIPKLSNVAQFFSLLKKDNPHQQLVYYQTGIGTYTSSNITDPLSSTIYKVGRLFA